VQHIEEISVCANEYFEFNGKQVSIPGTFYDTLYSRTGYRDSICQLIVHTSPTYLIETKGKILPGKQYYWKHDGKYYDTAGEYYDYQYTTAGCDSVFKLVVEWDVNKMFYRRLDTTVCENDLPLRWHGETYYHEGLDTIVSRGKKKDSLFVLNLHIASAVMTEQTIWLCEEESFLYKGEKISEGVLRDTMLSCYGCDSIVTMYVNRAPSYLFSDTVDYNDMKTHTWRGHEITGKGVYRDKLLSYHGCDSIYQLVVNDFPSYQNDTSVHICYGKEKYLWRGKYYTESGTYYDSLKTVHGMDSVFVLHLDAEIIIYDR
jgi:hypothetical protein